MRARARARMRERKREREREREKEREKERERDDHQSLTTDHRPWTTEENGEDGLLHRLALLC